MPCTGNATEEGNCTGIVIKSQSTYKLYSCISHLALQLKAYGPHGINGVFAQEPVIVMQK